MSAAPGILAPIPIQPFPPPLPEEDLPLLSPELLRMPPDQRGVVEGEGAERVRQIFAESPHFPLRDFLREVMKDIESLGGTVDGAYAKGGVIDHLLDGEDRPTSDLDLSIKINDERGVSFYHKANWESLRDKIIERLESKGCPKDQLKNIYLHFDEKSQEYHLLISFPIEGSLRSIDLQIVLKQKISCLTSLDSIQVDLTPFLRRDNGEKQQVLFAKTVSPYRFSTVMEQRRVGDFEVFPSSREILKGIFDCSRKLLRAKKPIHMGIFYGYWCGFQEQYLQDKQLGAFQDHLARYLIDHYSLEPLKALLYLLNFDSLVSLLCQENELKAALRAIISSQAHHVMKLPVPEKREDLISALQEMEGFWLALGSKREAPFSGKGNLMSDPNFLPCFFQVTLPTKKSYFFYHNQPTDQDMPKDRLARTLLGQTVLPQLFLDAFPLPPKEEKEKAKAIGVAENVKPAIQLQVTSPPHAALAAKAVSLPLTELVVEVPKQKELSFQEILASANLKVFLSCLTPELFAKLNGDELVELGKKLTGLNQEYRTLSAQELNALRYLQVLLIQKLSDENRSFQSRKIAGRLITFLGKELEDQRAFPLAKILIERFSKIEVERSFAVQFYNRFFLSAPNLSLAFERMITLFDAFKEDHLFRGEEIVNQLVEPFLTSPQYLPFFFQEAEKIVKLPSPLFVEFFAFTLQHMQQMGEREEGALLASLARYEAEKEKDPRLLPLFGRVFRLFGKARPRLKEKLEEVMGNKKKEKVAEVVAPSPKPEKQEEAAALPPAVGEVNGNKEKEKVAEVVALPPKPKKQEEAPAIAKAVELPKGKTHSAKKASKQKAPPLQQALPPQKAHEPLSSFDKSLAPLIQDCEKRIQENFHGHPLFDRIGDALADLNKKANSLLDELSAGPQMQEMASIIESIEQWYESEMAKTRGKKKESFAYGRVMNELILNHERFVWMAVDFLPPRKKEMWEAKRYQEIVHHLAEREMTPFIAIKVWVLYLENQLITEGPSLLRPRFLDYQNTLARVYAEEKHLQEILLFLEDQMMTKIIDLSLSESHKAEDFHEANFYLSRILPRAYQLNPNFATNYFNYGFYLLSKFYKGFPELQKEAFQTLGLIVGNFNENASIDWLAHMDQFDRARIYHMGLELTEQISKTDRALALPVIEMLSKIAKRFPLVLAETPMQERVKVMSAEGIQAMIEVVNNLLRDGKAHDALQLAQTLLKLHPFHPLLFILVGKCLEKLDLPYYAINSLSKAHGFAPRCANLKEREHYILSSAHAVARVGCRVKEFAVADIFLDDVFNFYRKVKGFDPDNLGVLLEQRGRVLRQLGYEEEAIANFSEALDIDPKNKIVLLGLAESYAQFGKLRESVDSYRKIVSFHPNDKLIPKIIIACSEQLIKLKEYDLAIKELINLEKQLTEKQGEPTEEQFLIPSYLVHLYLMKNEPKLALQKIRDIYERDPVELEGLWAEWKAVFDWNGVERDLLARIQKNKRDVESLFFLLLYYRLEKRWQDVTLLAETIQQLNLKSRKLELLSIQALSFYQMDDWEKASELYEKLMNLARDKEALFHYADSLEKLAILYWNAGKLEKSLAMLVLKEKENFTLSSSELETMGVIHFLKKDWKKTFDCLDRSHWENDSFDDAGLSYEVLFLMKSLSLMKMGRYEEAFPQFSQFILGKGELTYPILEAAYYTALKTKKMDKLFSLLVKKSKENSDFPLLEQYSGFTIMALGREEEFLEDYEKDFDDFFEKVIRDLKSELFFYII